MRSLRIISLRFMLLGLLVLCVSSRLHAQQKEKKHYWHEIGVGIGKAIEWHGGNNTETHSVCDFLYFCHVSKSISIGGSFGYSLHDKADDYNDKSSVYILPAIKWMWKNGHIIRFYTKAGFGISHFTHQRYNESEWEPAIQLTPIGIEIGKKLCFYTELGGGVKKELSI
ncbi:MAG: hypothetical protein IJP82_08540 [Bacteroidaceae bacterium]|nr:hypothetical protein [Bacteroidaceae bacterium]